MNKQELINNIKAKKSFLCVGLDPDIEKMPEHLKGNLFEFNKAIIDATAQYTVAYKPNLAFYEVLGWEGVKAFEETVKYIQENHHYSRCKTWRHRKYFKNVCKKHV